MPVCATCKGHTTVVIPEDRPFIGVAVEVGCPECKGTGETGNLNACRTCNDSKKIVVRMNSLRVETDCPDCSAPVVLG